MPEATMLPSARDAMTAAEWLSDKVVRTPVIRVEALDELAGARIWLKAENLQRSGSYKFRGAMRAVGRLAVTGAHLGVVAQSTGNHAIAVALAARELGMAATVVLPHDVPALKKELAESFGAKVIITSGDRHEVLEAEHARSGYVPVDAYDHPDVICGQATATLDLVDEIDSLDAVVLPVGGGGGIAGACLATRGKGVDVYGVEPVGNDSLRRSLAVGQRVSVIPAPTLADGLRPATVGALPFAIARDSVAGVFLVDDEQISRALRLVLAHTTLLVEPAAAAALAGAFQLVAETGMSDVGVVLTGGNVDPLAVGDAR